MSGGKLKVKVISGRGLRNKETSIFSMIYIYIYNIYIYIYIIYKYIYRERERETIWSKSSK